MRRAGTRPLMACISMRISIFQAVFFAFFLGGPACLAEDKVQPFIWSSENLSLKLKPYEKDIKREFECMNNGSKVLELKLLGASCGCIDVEPKELTIEPGKTGKITVGVDVRLVVSKQSKYLLFKTSAPDFPVTKLTLTIRPPLDADEPRTDKVDQKASGVAPDQRAVSSQR